jgi:hypothetical protein
MACAQMKFRLIIDKAHTVRPYNIGLFQLSPLIGIHLTKMKGNN